MWDEWKRCNPKWKTLGLLGEDDGSIGIIVRVVDSEGVIVYWPSGKKPERKDNLTVINESR
jgi:hypothetical protein